MFTKEFKQVGLFFVLTLFLSYFVFWGPIAIFQIPTVNLVNGSRGPIWAIMLFIIGGFIPSIVGLILTRFYDGKSGVRQLLKSSFNVKISLKWYLFMILINVYFAVALIIIYTIIGGSFDYSQFYVQLPTIIPLIILGPLSEEYGWRGFAQKRLLKTFSPNISTLLVGLVWSLWHLPLFYMLGTTQNDFNMPFIVFLISVTSISFVYTYVYIKTKFNLFTAIFLHWLYTYCIQVVSTTINRSSTYNWLEFIPALILGIVFMFILKKKK